MEAVTRSSSVTDQLREWLLHGEFAPQTRLQEVALAERLNVSRTPVREALRVLAKDGLLVYAPNRGYMVRHFTLDDMLKAFRVRGVLEGLGARLAAENGLDQSVDAFLKSCLDQAIDLLEKDLTDEQNYEAWRTVNKQFHVTILTVADNERLLQAAKDSQNIPILFNGSFKWYCFDDFRRSHDHHCAIYDAIRKRQSERADRLMQEHVYTASEILKENYNREFGTGMNELK